MIKAYVNTLELKAHMVKKMHTNETLGDKIGISCQSYSYKLNNVREFTSSEIARVQKALQLSDDERDFIFFGNIVDE